VGRVSDANNIDQVLECSIAVESGAIVAAGCTGYFPDAARIKIPYGTYQVRVSLKALTPRHPAG
jgi:hypothetical protein